MRPGSTIHTAQSHRVLGSAANAVVGWLDTAGVQLLHGRSAYRKTRIRLPSPVCQLLRREIPTHGGSTVLGVPAVV